MSDIFEKILKRLWNVCTYLDSFNKKYNELKLKLKSFWYNSRILERLRIINSVSSTVSKKKQERNGVSKYTNENRKLNEWKTSG